MLPYLAMDSDLTDIYLNKNLPDYIFKFVFNKLLNKGFSPTELPLVVFFLFFTPLSVNSGNCCSESESA